MSHIIKSIKKVLDGVVTILYTIIREKGVLC